jgi:hypothetical protein
MIRQTIHAAIFVALAIGAAHSYDEVRFGERTLVFFKTAFAERDTAQMRGGRGGSEGRGRGGRGMRRGREEVDVPAERGEQSDEIRETRRERSSESRGHGGHGGRGASISLEEVTYYTIIFAFATMLTYSIDGIVKGTVRGRRVVV